MFPRRDDKQVTGGSPGQERRPTELREAKQRWSATTISSTKTKKHLRRRQRADAFICLFLLPTSGYGDLSPGVTDSFTIMPQTRRGTCVFPLF